MPVFVVGRETTLAALDRRLFKADVSAAAIKRVHKAIRDLNPGVDFNDLQPGLVLELPRAPELRARADLSFGDIVVEGVATIRDHLQAELKELGGTARSRLRAEAVERRALAERLESQEVQRPASQDDEVMAALKSVLQGIADDDQADEERQAVVKQAINEWMEELSSLDRLVP